LAQVEDIAADLRACGLGRGARVAVVLPNGPEMAVTFLAIATAGMGCAPLNPAYRREELDFAFDDLHATALVVPAEQASPAVDAARALGIDVLRLHASGNGVAGAARVHGDGAASAAGTSRPIGEDAHPDDVALLLHTSGTTSRPKLVALTQQNLVRSAATIANALSLGPNDRCLNIMPLFHVHGLVGAMLASLAAGASVACTPGFDALKFARWLREISPTWYTAVPTMQPAILARAAREPDALRVPSLRFVRSCSAALQPGLMAELESAFAVPVVEAYGMTEATHQISCNPLPPSRRKPGSVGVPTGVEVAVADEDGRLLAQGQTGEVVLRGGGVISRYESPPEANESSFFSGWFRTGDRGHVDEDGYVHLTGRLKEIINRGGEKISPAEIDAVLCEHPAVAQAVAFAVPNDQLGEEVGAAVVLREGATADVKELRSYLGMRLAPFKVPRRIVIVAEIPKGPTGKLQRIGLAQRLGLG
jgi:acyl-CoA synthetase (AMP-forming)/AMP-acid ligase II